MPPDLKELSALSVKLGCDPEQVQAAGGNTSIKIDNILWVKASGFWLKDAGAENVFVPVDLVRLRHAYADELDDPVTPAVIQSLNPQNLRPSIETSLHALMPHPVVVHTHSVRTIAMAIRQDWRAMLEPRLDGLNWCFVPYVKPGLDLTNGLMTALAGSERDVVVLGNHGLVVGGSTVNDAEALLAEVEERLDEDAEETVRLTPRPAPPAGYRHVLHRVCDHLAYDPRLRSMACKGSLYPDHVIFLGTAAVAENPGDGASRLWLNAECGALLPEDAGPSADEMALCLALVLQRLPEDAPLHYLSAQDEAALLDWDAEKYRQALAKKRAAGKG